MNVVRVLPGVYNESDIIEENLRHYANHGIPSVVVDNGSSDGTFEICESLMPDVVVALKRIPTRDFNVLLLLRVASLLYKSLKPDWVVLADADEFIEPMGQTQTLRDAVVDAGASGFTLVRTLAAHFRMTLKDDSTEECVQRRMRHYGMDNLEMHHKVYKDDQYVDLFHPHFPVFFDQSRKRVADRMFVLKHYPLRSLDQARRKLSRVKPALGSPFGWSTQYMGMTEQDLLVDDSKLTHYTGDGCWSFDRKAPSYFPGLGTIAKYYIDKGPDFVEVLVEQLRQDSATEEDFWMRAARVYGLAGNRERKVDCLRKARESAQARMDEIEERLNES